MFLSHQRQTSSSAPICALSDKKSVNDACLYPATSTLAPSLTTCYHEVHTSWHQILSMPDLSSLAAGWTDVVARLLQMFSACSVHPDSWLALMVKWREQGDKLEVNREDSEGCLLSFCQLNQPIRWRTGCQRRLAEV